MLILVDKSKPVQKVLLRCFLRGYSVCLTNISGQEVFWFFRIYWTGCECLEYFMQYLLTCWIIVLFWWWSHPTLIRLDSLVDGGRPDFHYITSPSFIVPKIWWRTVCSFNFSGNLERSCVSHAKAWDLFRQGPMLPVRFFRIRLLSRSKARYDVQPSTNTFLSIYLSIYPSV